MHLLECSVGGLAKGENGPLRPALTFRKQGHRQKDRNRSGCKSDANLGIATCAKAPFQGRADIVETGKVGCSFGPARQGRPVGPALLQPLPKIGRVANGQVGKFGVLKMDVDGVGAGGVQEPVAHHGPMGRVATIDFATRLSMALKTAAWSSVAPVATARAASSVKCPTNTASRRSTRRSVSESSP
jgi:hypothetical protein